MQKTEEGDRRMIICATPSRTQYVMHSAKTQMKWIACKWWIYVANLVVSLVGWRLRWRRFFLMKEGSTRSSTDLCCGCNAAYAQTTGSNIIAPLLACPSCTRPRRACL